MSNFKYRGLQELEKELNSTAVISEYFKQSIWGWVILAIQESHREGYEKAREKFNGD